MKAVLHRATIARSIAAAVTSLAVLASVVLHTPATAQDIDDALWTEPVNLSRSGAASAPVIAAAPSAATTPGADGVVQAFWWDRFDGLATAIYDPETASWRDAAPAPIQTTRVQGTGENATLVVEPIRAMPRIVADTTGRVHAFWLGAADPDTKLQPQLLSRLRLDTTDWTGPSTVSESVSAWALDSSPRGVLHLAYVRPIETERFPAGIYYKRSTDNGATWSALQMLVPSRYFRIHTAEQLNLALQARDGAAGDAAPGDAAPEDGEGIFIAWDDPRLGTTYLLTSTDGGETWSEPVPVGTNAETTQVKATKPHFMHLGNGTALLWEAAGAFSGCELYQQTVAGPGAGDTFTPTAAIRVLADLTTCPVGLRSMQMATPPGASGAPPGGVSTILIAGEGTGTLTLFGWDGGAYSLPQTLSFSFEDPDTGARVTLTDLRATLSANGRLFVVGSSGASGDGEIWALHTSVNALDLAFAPPSPWSDAVVVAAAGDAGTTPGVPTTAVDTEGRLHLLWTEGPSLRYSRRDVDARFSQPVTVATSTGGTGSPTLLALGDRLHAVWAQGSGASGLGEVVYSSAYTRDAYAAGTWTEPVALSLPGTAAAAPALLADAAGAFHVVFAVPLNEGRGIYYTRSQDLGSTWSAPVTVFDATQPQAATGAWPQVDHVALAADAAGTLHAVFVQGSANGPFPPQALWHARSTDGGESWSAPFLIVEATVAHPRVAAMGAQILVLWQDLDRGTLSMRTSADYGITWSYQQAVPGFQATQGAVALLTGGPGAATLVGLTQDFAGAPALQVTSWDGARFTPIDSVDVGGASDGSASDGGASDAGAAAALDPDNDLLHVLSWAEGASTGAEAGPQLRHTARDLTATASGELQAPVPGPPTPTPTAIPSPTPVPTPRPTVNAVAPRQGMPTINAGPLSLPLSAVGGIVGVAVLVLGAVVVIGRKR